MQDLARQAAASPGPDDFATDAHATITRHGNGEWDGVVRGEENIRRAIEMQDGARAIEIERGKKLAAGQQRESFVHADGRRADIPEHLLDQVVRKPGIRARTSTMLTGGWLPNAKDRAGMERSG